MQLPARRPHTLGEAIAAALARGASVDARAPTEAEAAGGADILAGELVWGGVIKRQGETGFPRDHRQLTIATSAGGAEEGGGYVGAPALTIALRANKVH